MFNIETEDTEIIKKSIELLNTDSYLLLCSVLQTWGSSPRPAGSLMLISEHGQHYGSVSGGCIEDDLLEKHKHGFFEDSHIKTLLYDHAENNNHVRIPCGSSLKISVEKFTNADDLTQIYNAISLGQRITRTLNLKNNSSSLKPASDDATDFHYDADYIIKTYGTTWKILIIGANHIASYIVPLAKMLGFKLIICEPREAYRKSWCESDCELTTLMPDDAVRKFSTDFYSIVLSLSHDPKLDDMALMIALDLKIFYVGAIGSKKNNNARIERLKYLGLSDENIKKLHAPVGLNISSKTPAEIAISIFAQLIDLKYKLSTK